MEDVAEKTDIVALVEATPVLVLTDKERFNQFYDAMKRECDAHEPDLTTEKGRKAIASLAYKVARTKTAIDDAGKKLNEEARAKIKAVDDSRREIRDQLDALKEEVRRPLTDWEEAEEKRQEQSAEQLAFIRDSARVDLGDKSDDVEGRLKALSALEVDEDLHGDRAGIVRAALADSIEALEAARDRLKREEEERAELERLRAAEAERQREAAEKQRKEDERRAKEEEARRKEEEARIEQDRLARIAKEAEERAQAEAQRKAREESEAKERAHQEALADERRRAERAEAEKRVLAEEEAKRRAQAEREAEEQRKREADRDHRSKIMKAAKEAIMEAGCLDEPIAKTIVLAIAAGNVPNVEMRF